MKSLREKFEKGIDYFVAHFTLLSIIYAKVVFALLKKDKRFSSIKNTHEGERCFIVALGPSLTVDDLNKLKENNEYCFSMNRCYQLFDKTDWRPNCYFISDSRSNTPTTREAIKEMIKNKIMVIYNKLEIKNIPEEAIYYKANNLDFIYSNSKHKRYQKYGHLCRFSTNADDFVYNGHSCVLSILQIAYYMGFSEVYLLGQDCGVSVDKKHAEGITSPKNPHQSDDLDKVILDFDYLNKDLQNKNLDFKIYNCTRGGRLEVFPRISLDEVLKK